MRFKEYNQDQGLALPPYLEELIAPDHLVRVINSVVDQIDVALLCKGFKSSQHNKGGNLPYHPGMMLKVLIYAYATGTYTSRKIAEQVRENVHFMWLTGMQKPDFRTINRYRSVYLKDALPILFSQFVGDLYKKNLIDLDTLFVDGTKIEGNCNKHKVVWSKNVKRFKENISKRVEDFLGNIDKLDSEEMKRYGDLDLPQLGESSELTSSYLQEMSDKINDSLTIDGKRSKTEAGKKLRKASRQLKEDSKKMAEYESQEKILNGRNSYSKTDPDAGVQKMKNDEIRPGYNVQAVTNKGFILDADVSQNANDGTAFIPFMENILSSNLPSPNNIVADPGYGHEEVYNYLDKAHIRAYIKYPAYRVEDSNEAKYKYHYSKFRYVEKSDMFICPAGKELHFIELYDSVTRTGYRTEKRKYRCSSCNDCQYKEHCVKSGDNRTLTVSFELKKYQKKAREDLSTVEGESLYGQRAHAIETVFGEWKHNGKFRRFILRGLSNIRTEIKLLSFAYNIRKLAKYLANFISFLLENLYVKWQKLASLVGLKKISVEICFSYEVLPE